jgi:hypothetical protein
MGYTIIGYVAGSAVTLYLALVVLPDIEPQSDLLAAICQETPE